jgi:hypothetical protein
MLGAFTGAIALSLVTNVLDLVRIVALDHDGRCEPPPARDAGYRFLLEGVMRRPRSHGPRTIS